MDTNPDHLGTRSPERASRDTSSLLFRRSAIRHKFVLLADRFSQITEAKPQSTKQKSRQALRHWDLEEQAGLLVIEAVGCGWLGEIPGLPERVDWHTAEEPDTIKSPGKARRCRRPSNLWLDIVGSHSITVQNGGDGVFQVAGGDTCEGLLQRFAPRVFPQNYWMNPDSQCSPLSAFEHRCAASATACRLLTDLIALEPVSSKGKRQVNVEWITVGEASDLLLKDVSGITPKQAKARVSKAANAGKFKTNGRTRQLRRIDRDSFSTWRIEQREKDLDKYDKM